MRRVLLDEGVPQRLSRLLRDRGVDAHAFPDEWRSLSDRNLIDAAMQAGFTILVTQDRNMPFQRPLSGQAIAILIVPSLDRRAVLRRLDEIADRPPRLESGRYALLGREGSLPNPPRNPL